MGPSGDNIIFRSVELLEITGIKMSFDAIQTKLNSLGEIALGVRLASQEKKADSIYLNPAKEEQWKLKKGDEIIVLSKTLST